MLLKRKRSIDDGMSSSSVINHIACSPFSSNSGSNTSASLVSNAPFSRTMKRVRDLRPSEEQVHQHTLNLLMKGQREHAAQQKLQLLSHTSSSADSAAYVSPAPSPAPQGDGPSQQQQNSEQTQEQAAATEAAQPQQQRSLHNFWKLPSTTAPAPPTSIQPITVVIPEVTACDDCGKVLSRGVEPDGGDVDMEDGYLDSQCTRLPPLVNMVFRKGIRPASHAGSWYEDDAQVLSDELDEWLDKVPDSADGENLPLANARAIIAPHAGYTYSGQAAAWAYKNLNLDKIKRVFVLGPSHTYYLPGCALSTAESYATPFGNLRVDTDIVAELGEVLYDSIPERNEVQEHSLEMHMPYLYKCLERTHGSGNESNFPSIVPILVGDLHTDEEQEVGKLLAKYLRDPTSALIVSSDFCHWGKGFRYCMYAPDKTIDTLAPLHEAPPVGKPKIHETIEMIDRMAMDAIETGVLANFKKVLDVTENTICGRNPIGVAMAIISELQAGSKFKFVRYERSMLAESLSDSSVSYASAYAVLE
ncbi:Protein MEMO1 [Ceratocystis lukuohia]|uniref:Protein MEMO1 n=1 Tax=Ceratocystis lukuohia TaxID=2019550 RepID=A0ABR4MRD6_9PEZI